MEYIVAVAAFVAGVALLFLIVRGSARILFGRSRRLERDLSREVLRDRLRRGEITQAQFDNADEAIGNG